jgi:uncharacterized protein (DUF2141 family)
MFRIAIAAVAACFVSATAASAGELEVTLTGVEARGGVVLASVQTEDQFMGSQGVGAMQTITEAGTVTFVFRDLPPGEYVFSAFHDENGNWRMERDQDYWPLEGWAMSNGQALRGEPAFAMVKFTVAAEGVTRITEPMIYPARD